MGLLWALEGLAWDRALLPGVSLILAAGRANHHSQVGKLPHRSLAPKSSCPGCRRPPHQSRSGSECCKGSPSVGLRLDGGSSSNCYPTGADVYADLSPFVAGLALAWSAATPATHYWDQACASARLLVEQIGDNVGRWTTVIQQFEHLPGPVQKEFLKRLCGFAQPPPRRGDASDVSDTIREKVSVHRKFAGTNWALRRGHARRTRERSERFRAGRCRKEERVAIQAAMATFRNARL